MNNFLRYTLLLYLSLGCVRQGFSQLDSVYHTPTEIIAELSKMAEAHPDLIRLDTITRTEYFDLPVVLAKISTTPDQVQSKPAILFIGQVHAEEVTGVELTLHLMHELLDRMDDEAVRRRIEGLELYFIPTLNPDGLEIICQGFDRTFRKNGRDNVGDGNLRIVSGMGRDTTGVDLNRNFGLHWERGDSLYFNQGAGDAYNYYRGPAPFSEPETRAVRDLMLDRRFLFAISYHSSRSGRNAELVIGPWNWEGRNPPDDVVIQALGSSLAQRLPSEDGFGNYLNVRATQRVGQEQDWAYQATGTLMYMIELGQTVQPDSALLAKIVNDATPSALHLMDLAIGESTVAGTGLLSVTVIDRTTGEPVTAEVIAGAPPSPLLEPRLTDKASGRFDQLLRTGQYTLTVRAPGYLEHQQDTVTVPNGGIRSVVVTLQPRTVYDVSLSLQDISSDSGLVGEIMLLSMLDRLPKRLNIVESQNLTLPEGIYTLTVTASGYVPFVGMLSVSNDTNVVVGLAKGQESYIEEFTENLNWQHGGVGADWGIRKAFGKECLTESLWADYAPNASTWILIETNFKPKASHKLALQLIHRPNFEPGADFCAIDIYLPHSMVFQRLATYSSFPHESFDTSYFDLTGLNLSDQEVRFRLWVNSDSEVEEDGWLIDRMSLYYADSPTSALLESPLPANESLFAFPNPTNGALTILMSLPTSEEGTLTLHDVNGREVSMVKSGHFSAGRQRLALDASQYSSGTYFLTFSRLNDPKSVMTSAPVLLIR